MLTKIPKSVHKKLEPIAPVFFKLSHVNSESVTYIHTYNTRTYVRTELRAAISASLYTSCQRYPRHNWHYSANDRGVAFPQCCARYLFLFKSKSILKILFEDTFILFSIYHLYKSHWEKVRTLFLAYYTILVLHVFVDSLLLDELCSSVIVIPCNHVMYAYP